MGRIRRHRLAWSLLGEFAKIEQLPGRVFDAEDLAKGHLLNSPNHLGFSREVSKSGLSIFDQPEYFTVTTSAQ